MPYSFYRHSYTVAIVNIMNKMLCLQRRHTIVCAGAAALVTSGTGATGLKLSLHASTSDMQTPPASPPASPRRASNASPRFSPGARLARVVGSPSGSQDQEDFRATSGKQGTALAILRGLDGKSGILDAVLVAGDIA